MKEGTEETFDCSVEKVIWRSNDSSGFSVMRVKRAGKGITITGAMPGVVEGDELRVTGQWVQHERFGLQVKVVSYETELPSNKLGIERWLANRLPGIGRKRAALLTEKFGVELWDVIEDDYTRLAEVRGITEEMAEAIHEVYQEHQEEREIVTWLYSLGLTDKAVVAVRNRWGSSARERIIEDPYAALMCIERIGWELADRVALHGLEWSRSDPIRLKYALETAAERAAFRGGDVYLPLERLLLEATMLSGADMEDLRQVLDESELVLVETEEHVLATRRAFAEAEEKITAFAFECDEASSGKESDLPSEPTVSTYENSSEPIVFQQPSEPAVSTEHENSSEPMVSQETVATSEPSSSNEQPVGESEPTGSSNPSQKASRRMADTQQPE